MKNKYIILTYIITLLALSAALFCIFDNHDEIVWIDKLMPITKANTDEKVVAFACNVYEGSNELDKIQDTLKKYNIKISFFIGGIWAKNNPNSLMKLKNNGHDIQNHGYLHKNASMLSNYDNTKEILKAEDIINKTCGVKTTLFEPPSGDYDENTLSLVNSLNYKLITWSIDTIDWRNDASEAVILRRISKKLHPGAIILIHPKPITADSMEDIIKFLQSKNYKVVTVSSLLKDY